MGSFLNISILVWMLCPCEGGGLRNIAGWRHEHWPRRKQQQLCFVFKCKDRRCTVMYKTLLWSAPLKNCDHIWKMSIGYSDRKFPDHVGPIMWDPWPNCESSDITSWSTNTATAIVAFLHFWLGYIRVYIAIGHCDFYIESIKMNIINQDLFEAATEMMPDVFFFSFLEAERSTVSSLSFFSLCQPSMSSSPCAAIGTEQQWSNCCW